MARWPTDDDVHVFLAVPSAIVGTSGANAELVTAAWLAASEQIAGRIGCGPGHVATSVTAAGTVTVADSLDPETKLAWRETTTAPADGSDVVVVREPIDVPHTIRFALVLLASRLYLRHQSIDGIVGSADTGMLRVGRIDPDIEALLGARGGRIPVR